MLFHNIYCWWKRLFLLPLVVLLSRALLFITTERQHCRLLLKLHDIQSWKRIFSWKHNEIMKWNYAEKWVESCQRSFTHRVTTYAALLPHNVSESFTTVSFFLCLSARALAYSNKEFTEDVMLCFLIVKLLGLCPNGFPRELFKALGCIELGVLRISFIIRNKIWFSASQTLDSISHEKLWIIPLKYLNYSLQTSSLWRLEQTTPIKRN